MIGRVHSIQSLSAVDGPGVRAVVFLSGCPLRCIYCHNPDTWDLQKGTEYDTKTLFDKILRFRDYFGEKGGVTVSGGEPLLQADFLFEFFTLCRRANIHTCLDTAGSVLNASVKKLLTVTDLCLLDIKFTTESDYNAYTGGSLAETLAFFDCLRENNIPTRTRHVIVPGLNDTEDYIQSLKEILSRYPNCIGSDLLPFRKLCLAKYEESGIPFPLKDTPETSDATIEKLKKLLK